MSLRLNSLPPGGMGAPRQLDLDSKAFLKMTCLAYLKLWKQFVIASSESSRSPT